MLFDQQMLTLDDAAKLLPGGKSKSALYRWWKNGYRGVRLECRMVGRNLYTSREALDRFTAAVADAAANPIVKPEPEAVLRPAPVMPKIKSSPAAKPTFDAEAILARAGIRVAS